jgi:hypothetical protein
MHQELVYLGHQPSGTETIAPALIDRNIRLLRASPSEINIHVLNSVVSSKYATYASNLSAYILANTGTTPVVLASNTYYPLQAKDVLPLRFPSIAVSFTHSTPAIEQLLSRLDSTIHKVYNQTVNIIERYNYDDLVPLLKTSGLNVACSCPGNATNAHGLRHLLIIGRIAHAFLCTQSYPTVAETVQSSRKRSRHHSSSDGESNIESLSEREGSPVPSTIVPKVCVCVCKLSQFHNQVI